MNITSFLENVKLSGDSAYRGKWTVGAAAPSASGEPRAVGDIHWHTDPGAADPVGWVCTTAGDPGTWTAFGGTTQSGLTLTSTTLTAPTINSPITTAGVGAKNGATVTSVENFPGVFKTVLTLAATPITLTDDAGVGQYGGVKLYDMPPGNILVLGAVVDADITLNEAWWLAAAEGDVGMGSTAPTDGDALATTEENIIGTTDIAALDTATGPINAQSDAQLISGTAGGTDLGIYLNVRIDDDSGHMPDVVTNGGFGADTDWTKGDGWTIAAGVADSDGSQAAASELSQAVTLVDGVSYILTFTLTRSAGSITPKVGGTSGTARSSADTFVETIVAGAADTLVFEADADFVGTVDDVSLTPVTGTGAITGTVTLTWLNLGDF